MEAEYTAEVALQCSADAGLEKRFNDWNGRAVDLPGLYFRQATEWLFRENRLACGCFPALGRPAKLSDIVAPVFVLAAAADEVVAAPQAIAAKALCRSTHVDVRVVPGRHLSLFMGRRTLTGAWRDIALWLEGDPGGRRPSASSGQR
jgi:poly(3-hydroxyalkanoate) synthetase